MARKTKLEFLEDKANILEQQLTNIENEKFQHELTVEDAKIQGEQITDRRAASALSNQALAAKSSIIVCDRRIAVRESRLIAIIDEIEAESKRLSEAVDAK